MKRIEIFLWIILGIIALAAIVIALVGFMKGAGLL